MDPCPACGNAGSAQCDCYAYVTYCCGCGCHIYNNILFCLDCVACESDTSIIFCPNCGEKHVLPEVYDPEKDLETYWCSLCIRSLALKR